VVVVFITWIIGEIVLMPALQKWKKGQPILASRLQAIQQEILSIRGSLGVAGLTGGLSVEPAIPIHLQNDLGRDLEFGEVIGLGNQANTSDTLQRVLLASEIVEEDHKDAFGIVSDQIPQGGLGYAYVAGVCLALVNVIDAEHKYAKVVDSEITLQSDSAGQAKIIWKESGVGESKLAVMKLGISSSVSLELPTNPYTVKHDNSDDVGSIDVWTSDLGKADNEGPTNLEDYDGFEHWFPGNVVYNDGVDEDRTMWRMWRVVTINRYGLIVRIRDNVRDLLAGVQAC
jgi:hypothetical protein